MDILKENPKSSTISLNKDGSWSESNATGITNYVIPFINYDNQIPKHFS